MKSLYKILAVQNQNAKKYFQNYKFYVKEIKKMLKENFKDVKVYVFGSVVRDDYRPDSDIDILIVSNEIPESLFEQAKIKVMIKKMFEDAPFEIHITNFVQYESWYKRFIKENYIEINDEN